MDIRQSIRLILLLIGLPTLGFALLGWLRPLTVLTMMGMTAADAVFFNLSMLLIGLFGFLFCVAARDPENRRAMIKLGTVEKLLAGAYLLVAILDSRLAWTALPLALYDLASGAVLVLYLLTPPLPPEAPAPPTLNGIDPNDIAG